MSYVEESNPESSQENAEAVELELLKEHATEIGLKFHHKVGLKKLREQIQAAQDDAEAPEEVPPAPPAPKVTLQDKKNYARKLVRVRVTCMNPNKREWTGEVIAVGNRYMGNIKKYVPFDNAEGWHVPQVLVDMLKTKKCQIFIEQRNSRGEKVKLGKLIPEYNVEIMPDLTKEEMKALAAQQALNHSIDRD